MWGCLPGAGVLGRPRSGVLPPTRPPAVQLAAYLSYASFTWHVCLSSRRGCALSEERKAASEDSAPLAADLPRRTMQGRRGSCKVQMALQPSHSWRRRVQPKPRRRRQTRWICSAAATKKLRSQHVTAKLASQREAPAASAAAPPPTPAHQTHMTASVRRPSTHKKRICGCACEDVRQHGPMSPQAALRVMLGDEWVARGLQGLGEGIRG